MSNHSNNDENNKESTPIVVHEHGANKTDSGLNENIAGALCYLAGFITGIIFLFIENENKFVRFHAWQSIFVSITFAILSVLIIIFDVVLAVIPIIGWIISLFLSFIFGLFIIVAWIYLMFQAYQGKKTVVPLAGSFAENMMKD